MSVQQTATFEMTAWLRFNGTNPGLTSPVQVSAPKCTTLVTASECWYEQSVHSIAAGIYSIKTIDLEQTFSSKSNVITQLLSYTHLWARVTLWTHQNVSILTSTQHILCHSPIQVGNVCAAVLFSSPPHQHAAIAPHKGYGSSQPTGRRHASVSSLTHPSDVEFIISPNFLARTQHTENLFLQLQQYYIRSYIFFISNE